MDQELTVSKNLVNYLYNNCSIFKKNNAGKCIDVLRQNYFVLDLSKEHWNNYKTEFNNLPNENAVAMNELERFIFLELFKDRIKEYDLIKDESVNIELELTKLSVDKILVDLDFTEKNIKQEQKSNPGIEFHNSHSLINPECYHRLKNVPANITLEKDKLYDWEVLLSPFLRSADSIEIKDPYLINPTAVENLKKIFKIINKNTKVKLLALKKDKYSKTYHKATRKFISNPEKEEIYNRYINEIDILKKNGYSILVNEYYDGKTKHRERYIYTDRFKIYIPGGLDCIDVDGNPNIDEQDKDGNEIRIDYINKS